MKIRSYGSTDCGLVRNENEDNLMVDASHQVFAVADGLGGLPEGARASSMAVEHLEAMLESNGCDGVIPFESYFQEIHNRVFKANAQEEDEIGMATTLTIAQLFQAKVYIGHMGDTGVFLFRDGNYSQLTVDHTMAHDMMQRMSEEEAAQIPDYFHHTLTRCIGQTGSIQVDVYDYEIQAGDRFLLYSDGVTKTWNNNELLAGFNLATDPQALVEQIIHTANQRGGPDNVTAIAIFIEE